MKKSSPTPSRLPFQSPIIPDPWNEESALPTFSSSTQTSSNRIAGAILDHPLLQPLTSAGAIAASAQDSMQSALQILLSEEVHLPWAQPLWNRLQVAIALLVFRARVSPG
ncbi:hypothetical protein [Lyngbya confervoides]|uniref:Uncharacterized protein n=1 Tax=Lyngbya confervoides BDU141951 TaxID=1574623 RepID=A0ABD4T055_9CYAN|nr:hypothetical protein [Lyngbya confervoides]MCM1981823.1 hypothetical protein [Lyngbya confervoides BDU141951]